MLSHGPFTVSFVPLNQQGQGFTFRYWLAIIPTIYSRTCILTLLYLSSQGKMRTRPVWGKKCIFRNKRILKRKVLLKIYSVSKVLHLEKNHLDPSPLAFFRGERQPYGRTHSTLRQACRELTQPTTNVEGVFYWSLKVSFCVLELKETCLYL